MTRRAQLFTEERTVIVDVQTDERFPLEGPAPVGRRYKSHAKGGYIELPWGPRKERVRIYVSRERALQAARRLHQGKDVI